MPLTSGSASVTRYRVRGSLPDSVRFLFVKGIRAHAFLPIDPNSDETDSIGWVAFDDREKSDLDLADVFMGDRLVLAMRHDTLKPAPKDVKILLAQKVRALEAETGNLLGRREKRLLKAQVVRELRRRIVPKVRTVEVTWDLGVHALIGIGRLHLWSVGSGANERFFDLFAKTFGATCGLDLEVEGPSTWANDEGVGALRPTPEFLFGFPGVRPGVVIRLEPAASGDDGEEGTSF